MFTILETARRWMAAYDEWFFRQAPPHALALFRIVFGLFLILYWGLYASSLLFSLGNAGIALPVAGTQEGLPVWLAQLIATPDPALAWTLYSLLLLSFLCIAMGVLFRPACAIALMLHLYFWASALHWAWFTMEQLSIIFLLILLCSGADKALSLHMRLRHGSWLAWESTSVLPQRLIALQITLTLLGAGWLKSVMPDWQDGGIVARSFMERWATPLAFRIARWDLPPWMYDRFTFLFTSFEMALPFGLWSRLWKWFLAGLALFLTMNALLLTFWWFLIFIPSYITFFEPEKIARKFNA